MRTRWVVSGMVAIVVAAGGLSVGLGCRAAKDVQRWVGLADNRVEHLSRMLVSLDGQPPQRVDGTEFDWQIDSPVSLSPTLSFSLQDAGEFTDVRGTSVSIYEASADGEPLPAPVFVVFPTTFPQDSMQPGVTYSLVDPASQRLTVVDGGTSRPVDAVVLKPATAYVLTFTMSADRNETAHLRFRTQ